MALEAYRKMRDFEATPEPRGGQRKRSGKPTFVIQKHAARRLHYDLRLEMDGVLKSWAVTRGPSLVPGEKRLSVHVEDHPLDYGSFEGPIPEGQYGAGTVIVWDNGTWSPVGDPAKGYAKGHLEFNLHGQKLTGHWHLIRMRGKSGERRENWLLIKGEDSSARSKRDPDILKARPESVTSGRTLEEVADKPGRKTKPRPARKARAASQAPLPEFVPPMLATLVSSTPKDDRWLHEIKFDGYRVQARIDQGKVSLLTRSGRDWTERFGGGLAKALAALPITRAIIDGEVVVEVGNRASDFSALQADLSEGRTDRMILYAFDLIHLDGRDLAPMPLVDRKRLLGDLLAKETGPVRFSDHVDDRGEVVLRHACRLGLEGVISKRRDSPYRSGRDRAWVKSKCSTRQEFVIGGYVLSSVSSNAIGSLVMGIYEGDLLQHVGRVGTGFSAAVAEDLFARLKPLEVETSPFAKSMTRQEARGVHHVRPDLAAEVDFGAWTADGHLRHAVFRGLREDKDPLDIVREDAASATSNPPERKVKLTHPDRIYWPDQGISKAGLADYYSDIWPQIAPHIVGRPLALLRCPDGIGGPQFFQKHAWKGLNEAILTVKDPADPNVAPLIAISDLDGLIGLVQAAALEIHPWGSTLDSWEQPDRIVMDLDPGEGVGWQKVIDAAQEVRQRLQDAGLAAFVKTSGGKGLHVVSPLQPGAKWPAVKIFCRDLAKAMASDDPDRYVATITKSKRSGKILIDYLRNQRGATAVAAFSSRARPGASVSTPLGWEELGPDIGPDHFTVDNLGQRLTALRNDPWDGFLDAAVRLPQKA